MSLHIAALRMLLVGSVGQGSGLHRHLEGEGSSCLRLIQLPESEPKRKVSAW